MRLWIYSRTFRAIRLRIYIHIAKIEFTEIIKSLKIVKQENVHIILRINNNKINIVYIVTDILEQE